MNLTVFYGAIILGLIYGLMVLGVFLTFRILDFPDLTVDGSITLGAAVAASLIVSGVNPVVATIAAPLAGAAAGFVTGALHAKFSIPPLLAGILSMIGLYSINLRVMGRPNVPLLRESGIFDYLTAFGISPRHSAFLLSFLVVVLFCFLLHFFLNTEIGYALRATGDNEAMVRSLGVNSGNIKILGVSLANGLVALGGAFLAQYQGFADISMGIGMIVAGLASVIMGEVILGNSSLKVRIIAAIAGSIIYRSVIALVLRLGFQATDLKLFTAVIVTIALISPSIKPSIKAYREKLNGTKSKV